MKNRVLKLKSHLFDNLKTENNIYMDCGVGWKLALPDKCCKSDTNLDYLEVVVSSKEKIYN